MNLKRYEFFVQTAKAGSFTEAAAQLGCSQSAVSQMISALEEQLGFKVMKRSRSGICLTEAGKLILPEIEAILRHQQRMEELCSELQNGVRGTVVIASFSSVAVHWLPEIFKGFSASYPNVKLKLNTGDYHDVAGWLESGTATIGFVTLPYSGSCKTVLPLYQDRLMAVVQDSHPLAGQSSFPVEQVAEEPFLSLLASSDSDARDYLAAAGIQPNIKLSTKDDYTLLAMVRSGLGMSIMPELLAKSETEGIRLLELEPPASRTIGIAITEEGKSSSATKAFAAFVQSWVKQYRETVRLRRLETDKT